MKIVTTPMCEDILKMAGVKDYLVNKNPDDEDADLAILLSESKVKMNSLPIKLNTFSQIKESIIKVSKYSKVEPNLENIPEVNYNLGKKVKVYSNFLKDIARDMGLIIVDKDYEYIIFPDYLKNQIKNENDAKLIEIPTHFNAPLNPIERSLIRYKQILLSIK